ncbi:MAG: peptide chain release factor N(5)-glutamine methyltransferase [Gaiellaceae bacterium]
MKRNVNHALQDAAARLASRLESSQSAGTDAVELLSRLLKLTRGELLADRLREVSDAERDALERWIDRRLAGEPVQYITGRAAFRSLDLAVDPRVLIPRPETEGLVECVLEALRAEQRRWPHPRVLDLGTGSGAIALAIVAEHPAAIVTATDASAAALEVARANAVELRLADRVQFLEGEWFDAVAADARFEVVISNPPYIAEHERGSLPEDVREHEPAAALFSGAEGTEALREIIEEAPRHLIGGGLLALELAESRAAEIHAWLEGAEGWERVELREDLAGQPRVLLARRAPGPAIAPIQWPEDPPPR